MRKRFCSHLDDYGAKFIQAEASYRHCLSLIDRIMAAETESPEGALADLLSEAVETWRQETLDLRQTFAELVKEGRIRLPRRRRKKPVCPVCKRPVPRLVFSEWEIPEEGPVRFRGEDLEVTPQPVQV